MVIFDIVMYTLILLGFPDFAFVLVMAQKVTFEKFVSQMLVKYRAAGLLLAAFIVYKFYYIFYLTFQNPAKLFSR